MELRSSRSRSKTPFVIQNFDKEIIEQGNHVEKSTTVVRTTRRTTAKLNESSSSTKEYSTSHTKPVKKSTKSEKSDWKVQRTSDYSSEDGDLDVSSSRNITQNERNQFIEDARALANGSGDISALDLYRNSDRYWDKYPKTDYTYSYYSRDRFEIAPGEVIMPNMSRRTIHNMDCSLKDTHSRSTNTESSHEYTNVYQKENLMRRKLFNNNFEDRVDSTEYTTTWFTRNVVRRAKRSFAVIGARVLTLLYFLHSVQTSFFSKIHRFCSWVMLLDTFLMRKSPAWKKTNKLVLLCLLPLLFFAAWWLLSSTGSLLYGSLFNSTTSVEPEMPIFIEDKIKGSQTNKLEEETVLKNIYMESPNAKEIAAGLSLEQLELIADAMRNKININEHLKTEEIIERILASPNFINIVNNYVTTQTSASDSSSAKDNIISSLREEINKIKIEMEERERARNEEINRIMTDFKNQNAENTARLTLELKECCQKPVIDIEAYVNRVVTSFLNNPDFLGNQKGFANWLQTILVAREDFEAHLANVTRNLNGKFEGLVENNGKKIMDEIANKITVEMNHRVSTDKRDVSMGTITDERIKKIVKSTLAIYDADKTGLVDFAMEPMGGQILTTRCTESYHSGKAVVSVLGIPLWYPVNTPRTVISPGINPGECWAFENFPGFLVIKLSNRVKIEAFSLEHVNKLLVPNGKIDSAPKNFEVYGLTSEKDRDPVKLGEYVYDYNGEPLQYFAVQNEGHIFDHIEIRITSNHGNPNYTCLYRFRVHGKLSSEDR